MHSFSRATQLQNFLQLCVFQIYSTVTRSRRIAAAINGVDIFSKRFPSSWLPANIRDILKTLFRISMGYENIRGKWKEFIGRVTMQKHVAVRYDKIIITLLRRRHFAMQPRAVRKRVSFNTYNLLIVLKFLNTNAAELRPQV